MNWWDIVYNIFGIGLITTLVVVYYKIFYVSNQDKTGIPRTS